MVTTTEAHTQEKFTQALRKLDPILADVFVTVSEQSAQSPRWQYMWVGYQQEQGALNQDREAAKVFQAFTLSQPDTPTTPDHFAKTVAAAITNPYQHMVDDYERSERRWIDEMSFRLADDEPGFTAQQRRSLDGLLQALRDELTYAEALITRGLRHHSQAVYAQGIALLERVYELT